MFRYPIFSARKRRLQGSVSLEVALILPMLLTVIVAASEILTILRVEQRLVNLNYNILEMVGNRPMLTIGNNIAQLPYYSGFAEQQLSNIAKGNVSLSIAMHNATTKQTTSVMVSSSCPLSGQWPDFAVGSLVEVAICFQPHDSVSDNAIWKLWPSGRFYSHMIREIN